MQNTETMLDKLSRHVAGEEDQTEQQIVRLESELLRHRAALTELQAENRYLRKRYRARVPYERLVSIAHRDALVLIILHQAGYPTTRRAVQDAVGIPARRWRRGVGLCELAALHNGYTFNLEGLEGGDILRMLADTAEEAARIPELLRQYTWR
jgi:DNA repair exonuclease SbcCD ATPase subunit